MRKEFKILGIILKKRKLKGRDLQVVLFTKNKGKLSVFAKGVQKITSRRLSHLDTGNLIRAQILERDDVFYLLETSLVSGFSSIKEEFQKSFFLFLVLKLFEKISPELQKDEELFNFLLQTIKKIDKRKFNKDLFIKKIAEISGLEREEILQMI